MTVQEIRAFNRFYTNLIGALDYGRHLYTPFTLTEARVLYELAHSSRTDAADLRAELSLDAGHLSRLLSRFEKDGLVERAPSESDPRRQRITLTKDGRAAVVLQEERSQQAVRRMLDGVGAAEERELLAAMGTVRRILGRPREEGRRPGVLLRDPVPGDLGLMVHRNAALYAAEYGWNAEYEALVARIVADYAQDHDPALERVWVAELEGRPVGWVMCVRDAAPATARLRLLLVEPDARGLGIGEGLVRACVGFAREAGYRNLVLWTNDVLKAARRIYQREGFVLTAEEPHHSYGADLVGQDWLLRLRPQDGGPGPDRPA
ncbi:bifunctional helix-turn-helix transcriptional regulator/GNAT family N-acetyltransferase [Streptomyces sp. GC420]|uniref:bifunctional helix-turn-helix transcriptional regulator/GNAT family N-acetyltransferase n=1 Tax=Streptomyces sp. GC420 TaxID=2697568 RepID=UPI001414FD12|nr:bifunctional helix-turn-helix transcriptional regulator/GNAT family N-acetyltransferase [Streptomyces sp. GC420]NBM20868.1 GNAT family N-acetyltransferase [Streptomyces sp. GC420]